MIRYGIMFVVTFLLLLAFEATWIGFIMQNFYRNHLGTIMRTNPHMLAGLFVWVCMAIGLTLFVFPKFGELTSLQSFVWGAVYGFILYGVYDGTNFAVLSQWPLTVALVDIIWGAFLNGIVTFIVYHVNKLPFLPS